MRAAIYNGPRQIEVGDRPDPVIAASTDAIVRVTLGCVCGSDLWYFRGASPHALGPIGHEFIGIVAPGARNAWHAHAVGQTLHVTEGVGLIQARGGEVLEIHARDTIHTPPGEWHWHGAAPDRFMTHIAIWEAPAEGAESQWGNQVTDAEYLATSPKEASR
jgi:hypothetical protein